jgi:hypothetical protein
MPCCTAYDCFWPKADIGECTAHVRFLRTRGSSRGPSANPDTTHRIDRCYCGQTFSGNRRLAHPANRSARLDKAGDDVPTLALAFGASHLSTDNLPIRSPKTVAPSRGYRLGTPLCDVGTMLRRRRAWLADPNYFMRNVEFSWCPDGRTAIATLRH